jgi:Translation initiation factor IF-3, N-terminal domain
MSGSARSDAEGRLRVKGRRGRQADGTAGLPPAPEVPRAFRHLRFVPKSELVPTEIAGDYPTRMERRLEPMTAQNDNDKRLRINEEIGDAEVQLIDQQGKNLGVVRTQVAIQMAADAGSDVVEIAPDAFPPVCKFLDRKLYARAK